jgi:flagellar basal-body rod modification protein FlgD
MSSAIHTALAAGSGTAKTTGGKTMASLDSTDFLKLMLAELTNQDPLEPMKNQDLLNQISSIRSLESQTSLTETLASLQTSGQLGSAAGLIGRQVSGLSASGDPVGGTVDRVRLVEGKVVLRLADGTQMPFEKLIEITAAPASDGAGV